MKILVCFKQVIDVELNLQIKDGVLVDDGMRYVPNAYDESALEAALKLKDQHELELTVLSMGPERVQEVLRKALSMGADQAIQLKDAAFEGGDSFAFAQALAALVQRRGYDLVIMGKQSQDTDAAQAGPMLAELLGWPQATNLITVELDGSTIVGTRVGDDGKEVLALQLPAVLTISSDFGEARIPTMKGIMGAKKKPLEVLELTDLGLDAAQVGVSGSKVELLRREAPPKRQAGRKLEGKIGEITREAVKLVAESGKLVF